MLRRGDDHRGVTWFDEEWQVVWLCAYGRHRSRESGDAFKKFRVLQGKNELKPTARDYELLLDDRAERFGFVVRQEVTSLLQRARADPGTEATAIIGTTRPVGILVYSLEDLEEVYVAVSGIPADFSQVSIVLAALYPKREFEDWRLEQRLPTRELNRAQAEICFSIVE